MKTSPPNGSAFPRENPKHWIGVTAEDIPQGWMDDMVKRLFTVLNRQLIRIESAQLAESDHDGRPPPLDPQNSAAQARTLASMQRTLERLTTMETRRIRARETKVTASDDDAYEELERRFDQLAAAGRAPKVSSGSDT
jgi:hypothetical protein